MHTLTDKVSTVRGQAGARAASGALQGSISGSASGPRSSSAGAGGGAAAVVVIVFFGLFRVRRNWLWRRLRLLVLTLRHGFLLRFSQQNAFQKRNLITASPNFVSLLDAPVICILVGCCPARVAKRSHTA